METPTNEFNRAFQRLCSKNSKVENNRNRDNSRKGNSIPDRDSDFGCIFEAVDRTFNRVVGAEITRNPANSTEDNSVDVRCYNFERIFGGSGSSSSCSGNSVLMERTNEFDRAVQRPRSSDSAAGSTQNLNSFTLHDPCFERAFGDMEWNFGQTFDLRNESTQTPLSYPPLPTDQWRRNYLHHLEKLNQRRRDGPNFIIQLSMADLITRRSNIHHAIRYVPMLLNDKHGFYIDLLNELIEESNGVQLEQLVSSILSAPLFFWEAVYCDKRSRSICRFVKKIKRTEFAHQISALLSIQFQNVGTCYNLKKIIAECFNSFTARDNAPLFEQAIIHLKKICTNKDGSKLMQEEIIPVVVGDQRQILLNAIAEASVFLAYEPFGNYVVSLILQLNNEEINMIVYRKLESKFVHLSLMKGASNVVEICIESSQTGLEFVVNDFLSVPAEILVQIAKNAYGNFVLQTALRICKRHGLEHFFDAFVRRLKPHEHGLIRSRTGRCVVSTFIQLDPQRWGI